MSAAPSLVDRAPPELLHSYNPSTGEALGAVPVHGPEDVAAAVDRARQAQKEWGALSTAERCKRLRAFTNGLYAAADRFSDVLALECGKPRVESWTNEIFNVLELAGYFLKRGPRLLADRPIRASLFVHRKSYLRFVPRPVTAIVGPWNFPHLLNMGPAIMAWIAGSSVVLKPSEATPLTSLLSKEIWDASGLPRDLFQVVTGYGSTGAALVESDVSQVIFTGSVATGRKVAESCARRLIPCTLELGGKAPVVVTENADLERAANGIVWTAFANSGQVCASAERVYAHERIHGELLRRVVEKTRALRQGPPDDVETDVGPIIFPRQLTVAKEQLEDAVSRGARVECGGARPNRPGQFFEPTVISNVDHSMRVAKEETFGPLLSFMSWRDEDEVIRLANDSHLGLLAYVYDRDTTRARRIAHRIEAGSVVINDGMANNGMPEAPWHGIKSSGLGRVHSDDGLRDLCEVRHINYNRIPLPSWEPYWYPYTAGRFRLWRWFLKIVYGRGVDAPWHPSHPPVGAPSATSLPKATIPAP